MTFLTLVLGTLSVWRLTHLLQNEDGPWDLVVRLRRRAGDGFWGKLMDCFYCLSLWVSVSFAIWLGDNLREQFLLWLSLSAGAILLQRAIQPHPEIPPAVYYEEKEQDHVMLRKTETAVPVNSERTKL